MAMSSSSRFISVRWFHVSSLLFLVCGILSLHCSHPHHDVISPALDILFSNKCSNVDGCRKLNPEWRSGHRQVFTSGVSKRDRRGIVLVDEDFDVPYEPGQKTAGKTDHPDIPGAEEEGSGTDPTSTTSWPLVLRKRKTTKRRRPSNFEDINGGTTEWSDSPSTTELSEIQTNPLETTEDSAVVTDSVVTYSTYDNSVVTYSEVTTELEAEGSGDEEEPSTAEGYIHSCLNVTCASESLIVLPGISSKVAQGNHLTLACLVTNFTGALRLYKYNESSNELLGESFETDVRVEIAQSHPHHSGRYVCQWLTAEFCCHTRLEVVVYETPNYRYHLIIVGLVAAASLFICLLLGICRNFKAKTYEYRRELENAEKPML